MCCWRDWRHTFCLHAAHSIVSNKTGTHLRAKLIVSSLESFIFVLPSFPQCCSKYRDQGWTHFRLQRLYFVWVCSELQSFSWFAELLCSVHHKVWTQSTCWNLSKLCIVIHFICANLCSFPLFKVITTTFRSSITWAEHFKCHLKRCFRFYRHLVAIRIQTLNTSWTFTSHAACLHPSRCWCLYSSIYFKVLCIKCIKPINSGYLFVFESNLFNCLWQLWQENRPDYFNMKLYVSQTDRIEVRVNHALLDAKISVHFSFPYFHHQIRN